MNIIYLSLSALSVWRITHLLSMEDGPFEIIYVIRKKAGNGFFGKLMDCFYCCSVWVALPFAIWLGTGWGEGILCWVSLSGAACLLQQATEKKSAPSPGVPEYTED